jgi:hypothetical protein
MAGNGEGTAASDSEDADRVYTLAQVLQQEFDALHHRDAPQKPRHAEATSDTKQQQPLADPSLAPTAKRIGGEPSDRPETSKAPSQQPDIDPDAAALRKLWENVHKLAGDGRSALCLSGGGVRSAAFNLGVLQGLARLGLLGRFHYLSTVSGGGYIGCWLSAWRRRSEKGIHDVSRGLAWPDHLGDAEVSPRVPDAISNLRRATNYLTPLKGLCHRTRGPPSPLSAAT